jgi:hypothetical protein
MNKATHRGNCQVCGHQQHVVGATLAKHGYTVEWGFFNGVCRGSGKKPVQVERSLTDQTVIDLGAYGRAQDAYAVALNTGEKHPLKIYTGQKHNRDTRKFESTYIDWAAGTREQRAKAVDLDITVCENEARQARAHALGLTMMANRLHGTPLVAIAGFIKSGNAQAVVDVKAGTVDGTFGSEAARKRELDKLSQAYRKQRKALQDLCLAVPQGSRTPAQDAVYYGAQDLHQWKARNSAAALQEFPQAATIVAAIEELSRARDAVKAAP